MSLVPTTESWFRQSFTWSNSWASWQERLTLAGFLLAAVGLGILSVWIPFWVAIALWAGYFVAVAVGSRQGWLQLFGPVLFYDMIRTARQSRYIVLRLLYASLMLTILWVVFSTGDHNWGARDPRLQSAVLAQTFFSVFMVVQLVAVILLTPAYVAGAISEEKDRKTLEFMLATDLNNHEIILSKLFSRLANITLFVLTGLPILSILQFVGGVDAELMLYGFAGTGLTMIGIASICILFSTLLQRPRDSIGLSYLLIFTYGALGTVGKSLTMSGVFFMGYTIWLDNMGPTLTEISDWLNAGNPLVALIEISRAIDRASLAADLPPLLTKYAYFHGILALVCVVWSIARLRAIALKQTVSGTTQKRTWWERYRPPIGDLPMIWKELHIEGRAKLNWVGWIIVVVLLFLTIGSGFIVIGTFLWDKMFGFNEWRTLPEDMNMWFRVAGTALACLMLLMMAVRASTCISHERDRDTMDALLTTPMSAESILWAKLIGCLTSMRLGWMWFGIMIAIALLTGGVHLLAVPLVLGAWCIYAVFFVMVGMWFSMVCRSSMRATVLSVLTTLFLGGGHWLLMGLCCYFPLALSAHHGPGDGLEYIAKFEAGMTPPAVIAFCSYSWEELAHEFHHRGNWMAEMIIFSLIGLFLWAVASLILWYGMLIPKFREMTRREEMMYRS